MQILAVSVTSYLEQISLVMVQKFEKGVGYTTKVVTLKFINFF